MEHWRKVLPGKVLDVQYEQMVVDQEAQTRRILKNVSAILEDAGTSLDNVVKVTVLLKDRSLFADFNEAYGEFFTENQPARTPIFTDTGASLVSMDFIAGME